MFKYGMFKYGIHSSEYLNSLVLRAFPSDEFRKEFGMRLIYVGVTCLFFSYALFCIEFYQTRIK